MSPYGRNTKGPGPAFRILTCGDCRRQFQARFIFVYPDASLRCVSCAGKKINLLKHRNPTPLVKPRA